MDLKLLLVLKEKLTSAKNFAEVWGYFLDHFGENDEFMSMGTRTESPLLEAVITQVGYQLCGNDTVLKDLLLVGVPEYEFIHGGCILGPKIANVLYFDDIKSGLLAIPWSLATSETKYARFSTRAMPQPRRGSPSLN